MNRQFVIESEVDPFPSVKRRSFISANRKEPGNAIARITGVENPYDAELCKTLNDNTKKYIESIKAI